MAKRKTPTDVTEVIVYPSPQGFRYTCRSSEGRVVWDSRSAFRTRRHARSEIYALWPNARVTDEPS